MALYAIGDTHLSLASDKPMDVFGGSWTGYVDKLRAWRRPGPTSPFWTPCQEDGSSCSKATMTTGGPPPAK